MDALRFVACFASRGFFPVSSWKCAGKERSQVNAEKDVAYQHNGQFPDMSGSTTVPDWQHILTILLRISMTNTNVDGSA